MRRELFNNTFGSFSCNRPFKGSHDAAHAENETLCKVTSALDIFFSPFPSTVGLFARPPSHVSSQSHESALLPSSPSQMGLDRSGVSDSSGASEEAGNLPRSPGGGLVIKEEPCDIDTVLIKWEMSEERFRDLQESPGSLDMENPCKSSNEYSRHHEVISLFCVCKHGFINH